MRTYGSIRLDETGQQWILKTEPHVAIRLKAIFPRIPKASDTYRFTNNPDTALDLEWFLSRYPLEISEEDRAVLLGQKAKEVAKREDLDRFLLPGYTPTKYTIKGEVRDYQAQGADVFIRNKALLLGDALGLGKTVTALSALTRPELLPAVVVCQTHLPPHWKEKAEQFLDAKIHLIKGTRPYSLPPADIYIMRYSCLAGWTPTYNLNWAKTVIFDEIQELRISGSQKYSAAKLLCENVEYKLGLSATPVYNYGDEIYNIINLLAPGMLGRRDDFMREWTSDGRIVKNPQALGTFLRENFLFLRRTRAEVGRELPPVNKLVYQVEYDEKAVEKMEDLARTLAIRVTTGSFVERGQAARELDIMVRQTTGVSKAKYVAQYVRILLENGEPVVLAGWHRAVYQIWAEELKEFKPVFYTGTESPNQKEQSKQDFISGKSNLFIISLRSGIGLDGLQHRCKVVVFGELDWSPKVHEQVIGRVDRDGQPDQVTAIYLVSNSGSDPLMVELLGLKAAQATGITDPLAAIETVHSDESRMKLLAERFLKKRGQDVVGPTGGSTDEKILL